MKQLNKIGAACLMAIQLVGCADEEKADSFQRDVDFMRQYTPIITLKNGDGLVAVSPSLQGRVMTSSSDGPLGSSYGWINKELFQYSSLA